MASWPSDDLSVSELDQGTDKPWLARTQILAAVNKIKTILATRGAASGIAPLDAASKVPIGNMPSGINATTLNGKSDAAFAAAAHVGVGGAAHAAATTAVNGFMSAADKAKLDGLYQGALVSVISGVVSHGAYVPLPAGYTEAQCTWTISMKKDWYSESFMNSFDCYLTGRLVTAVIGLNIYGSGGIGGQVNYLCIGVK